MGYQPVVATTGISIPSKVSKKALTKASIFPSLDIRPQFTKATHRKRDVRITRGIDRLKFYNAEQGIDARILPCKVSCGLCGTPIADEGRRMWLAFPSLFDFGMPPRVPRAFLPTCHIFYGSRSIDIGDDLPKWSGHKNHSERIL